MKHVLLFCTLLVPVLGIAQQQTDSAAVSVSICELTSNPAKYAGKRVEVRGRVTTGFENFTIGDEYCPDITNALWLTYGDQQEHVDYDQRYAAEKIPRTGFVRDREAKRLEGLLQAYRPFTPDGDECGESCSYYKVFATITGWFITGKHHEKGLGGLGHLGCCYLLVMERVASVTGKRTDVPYGGLYTCERDEWKPSDADLAVLSKAPVQHNRSSRDWRRRQLFSNVAQHWHDPEVVGGDIGIASNRWISSDLLRRYDIRTDNQATIITRELCRPRPNHQPKDLTSEVLCNAKYWETPRTKRKKPVQPVSAPTQEAAARSLISMAGNTLGISEPALLLNTCKDDEVFSNDASGRCSFATIDGSVSVWVALGRTQKRKKKGQYDWTGIPWSAYRIYASLCSQ